MTHLLTAPRNAALAGMMSKKTSPSERTVRSIRNPPAPSYNPQWATEHSLALDIHSQYELPWSKDAELELGSHALFAREGRFEQLGYHRYSAGRGIQAARKRQRNSPSQTDWENTVLAYSFLTRFFSGPEEKRRNVTTQEYEYYTLVCNRFISFLKPLKKKELWAEFLSLKVKTNLWAVQWNRTQPQERYSLRCEFEKCGIFTIKGLQSSLVHCPWDFDLIYNTLAYTSVMNITSRFEQLDILLTDANRGRRPNYEDREEFDEDFNNFRIYLANRLSHVA